MTKPATPYRMYFCGCHTPKRPFAFKSDRDLHENVEFGPEVTKIFSTPPRMPTISEKMRMGIK